MEYIAASCVISDGTVYKDEKIVFEDKEALLTFFLPAVYQHFHCQHSRFYKMDNPSKLGWLAAELLLKDGFRAADYRPEETGIVLSNSSSSLDTDIKYAETLNDIPSPSVFVYTLPNIMIGEICIRHNFKGENAFFLSESFDTVFIAQYVSHLMRQEICRVCICGWVQLLGEEYKAGLFLVEGEGMAREKGRAAPEYLFTSKNMDRIFQTLNA